MSAALKPDNSTVQREREVEKLFRNVKFGSGRTREKEKIVLENRDMLVQLTGLPGQLRTPELDEIAGEFSVGNSTCYTLTYHLSYTTRLVTYTIQRGKEYDLGAPGPGGN